MLVIYVFLRIMYYRQCLSQVPAQARPTGRHPRSANVCSSTACSTISTMPERCFSDSRIDNFFIAGIHEFRGRGHLFVLHAPE